MRHGTCACMSACMVFMQMACMVYICKVHAAAEVPPVVHCIINCTQLIDRISMGGHLRHGPPQPPGPAGGGPTSSALEAAVTAANPKCNTPKQRHLVWKHLQTLCGE